MRVLVTGGAGFIGSHFVESLLARGDEVFVVDDLSTSSLSNLAAVRSNPRMHLNVDTVLNHPRMDETIARCDQVVHLAAAVGFRKLVDEPVSTITTNFRGTEIVLDCCARHGVPLFLASTSEVYGKGHDDLHEEHDLIIGSTTSPRWAHACTKALGEFLALAYHHEQGLPVIVGRIFHTVGPRQSSEWGMVLPSFIENAVRGEPLQVYGTGEQRRCFCHVLDVVEAIEGLLACEGAWGHVFNIGSEEEVTIRELAERVVALAGSSSRIESIPYDGSYRQGLEDMERRRPDTARIRKLTGWAPRRDLDHVIRSTLESVRARKVG